MNHEKLVIIAGKRRFMGDHLNIFLNNICYPYLKNVKALVWPYMHVYMIPANLNTYKHTCIHICWYNFEMLWQRETHMTHKGTEKLSWIEPTTPRLSQHRQLPVVQYVRFTNTHTPPLYTTHHYTVGTCNKSYTPFQLQIQCRFLGWFKPDFSDN